MGKIYKVLRPCLLYILISVAGLGPAALIHWKYTLDLEAARQNYTRASHGRTQEVANDVERVFRSMYQGMRTIALLPGVRSIDRYAANFDADARQTTQELYNNLASNVAMSEVYIVPLDMEPDTLDKHTGKLQEPITTFDKLIVGHHADLGQIKHVGKEEEHQEVEEIEIYEYRLMRKQLDWFRVHCPREEDIQGLAYPALCGPEVITCDNTRYSPAHPDDKDRSGLVYSVPFYGPTGRLKGCISGIILTHALRDLLPSGDYALSNPTNDYTACPHMPGPWQQARQWVASGRKDPRLLYSEARKLNVREEASQLVLWAGQSDARFWARSDVQSAFRFSLMGYAACALLTFGLGAIFTQTRRHRRQIEAKNQQLEERVEARTAELRMANAQLQALATTDPLTGLPNHRALVAALDQEVERSNRFQRPCALLFLDLDHFKAVNDGYGHDAGDAALRDLSAITRACLRGMDTLGRWGGEEFMVLLPETPRANALEVAERVRAAVADHTFSIGGGIHLTCSVGVAVFPQDAPIRADLAAAADRAMYAAKRLGRNQVRSANDPALALMGTEGEASREEVALKGTVEALARIVAVRDNYTGRHTDDVAETAARVALQLGLTPGEARMVGLVGRLHDVGKVAIPDAILRKPGKLTPEEWIVMKQHAELGADIIERVPGLRGIAPSIRGHHEQWDGTGYPDGLKGINIPLGARIVAACDAYSAMTSDRPYRKAMLCTEALRELERCAGRQFDPEVVAALKAVLEEDSRLSAQAA